MKKLLLILFAFLLVQNISSAQMYYQNSNDLDEEELKSKIKLLKEEGFSQKDISRILSKLYCANKNKIYKMSLE